MAETTKQKLTTACNLCRSRKVACRGCPGSTCEQCLKAGKVCEWAAVDGRSSAARRQRRLRVPSPAVEAPPAAPVADDGASAQQSFASGAGTVMQGQSPTNGVQLVVPTTAPRSAEMVLGSTDFDWSSLFGNQFQLDPNTALPIFEVHDFSALPGPVHSGLSPPPRSAGHERRVVWWRSHGDTAVVSGTQRIVLNLRAADPAGTDTPPGDALFDATGRPEASLMLHLLDLFAVNLGSQFPYLVKAELVQRLQQTTGSLSLFNAIAAVTARFSTHPALALPHLQPHEYGRRFSKKAKSLLGHMLNVPSRDTVAGFLLLAMAAVGDDSESEVWMMTGLAVRMTVDLGLHLSLSQKDHSSNPNISADDSRLNRLLFGSVVMFDHSLAFGVGRHPSITLAKITQIAPNPLDFGVTDLTSPFPFAVQQIVALGRLVFHWNTKTSPDSVIGDANDALAEILEMHEGLPEDMVWSSENLRKHNDANQGLIYVNLHLWYHCILATGYIVDDTTSPIYGLDLWRHSVLAIKEIVAACEAINPLVYAAQPLVHVAFVVASCCHIRDLRKTSQSLGLAFSSEGPRIDNLRQSLVNRIVAANVSCFESALLRMTEYWSGISWILKTVRQRMKAIDGQADLSSIREDNETYVFTPDASVLPLQPSGAPMNGSDDVQWDIEAFLRAASGLYQ